MWSMGRPRVRSRAMVRRGGVCGPRRPDLGTPDKDEETRYFFDIEHEHGNRSATRFIKRVTVMLRPGREA